MMALFPTLSRAGMRILDGDVIDRVFLFFFKVSLSRHLVSLTENYLLLTCGMFFSQHSNNTIFKQ